MYEDGWNDDGYAWENEEEDEWEGYCRTCNQREQNCACDLEEETCGPSCDCWNGGECGEECSCWSGVECVHGCDCDSEAALNALELSIEEYEG